MLLTEALQGKASTAQREATLLVLKFHWVEISELKQLETVMTGHCPKGKPFLFSQEASVPIPTNLLARPEAQLNSAFEPAVKVQLLLVLMTILMINIIYLFIYLLIYLFTV